MEICTICNKKFKEKESLEQHVKAKHNVEEEKPRKGNRKYFLLIGLILAIVFLVSGFYVRSTGAGIYDNFANCLKETGAVIYGNDFCQYTAKQLNSFGKSEKYLGYVKCIDNKELCDSKNVKITPTWEINSKMYEGVQSFDRLSALSGCEV